MSSGPAENQQFLIVDSRQIINARIFARHPPELLEISRTDVTPRGTAVGWSQVSRGQSPLGNAQLWFLPRSPPTLRVELKHLNDITSALSSPYSPPPAHPSTNTPTHTHPNPHTHNHLILFRFGWWRYKAADRAVFSLFLVLPWIIFLEFRPQTSILKNGISNVLLSRVKLRGLSAVNVGFLSTRGHACFQRNVHLAGIDTSAPSTPETTSWAPWLHELHGNTI